MIHIAFCGIDGAGKTTSINILKNILLPEIEVKVAKCPFSSKKTLKNSGWEYLEKDKTTEIKRIAMAFEFAKYYQRIFSYHPQVLLSDRYSICYQILNEIDNVPFQTRKIMDSIYNSLPEPNLYIFCDVDPVIAVERIKKRKNYIEDEENAQILTAISQRYQEYFSTVKIPKIVIEPKTIEELQFEMGILANHIKNELN